MHPLRLTRRAAPILAAALLAACGETETVTRVDRLIDDPRSYVTPMAIGGVPTEIYGAPLASVTPEQALDRLRLPGGYPADVSFRPAASDERNRLVAAFNSAEPPDGYALCRGALPRTEPPAAEGFTALASFCAGDKVIATGFLQAPEAGGPEAYGSAMARLIDIMLRETR